MTQKNAEETSRQQKVTRLLARLREESGLTADEIALVEWCSDFYRPADLNATKMRDVLERHQHAREKRAKKHAAKQSAPSSHEERYDAGASGFSDDDGDEGVADGAAFDPKHRRKAKKAHIQQERRRIRQEAFQAYEQLLESTLEPQAFAEARMGHAFAVAFGDLLREFYDEAIRGVASSLADREMSWRDQMVGKSKKKTHRAFAHAVNSSEKAGHELVRHLEEVDRVRVSQRYLHRIEEFAKQTRENYERRVKVESVWSYYEGYFRGLWEEAEEEARTKAIELGFDMEPLLQFYREEALHYVRHYQGQWDVQKARDDLKAHIIQMNEAVVRRIEEESIFKRLVSLYESHSDFASCFPVARGLKRRIEFFCGPTNSGKTHAAMDALAASESGVYLAPLRLLALEGQENLLRRGVKASFLTGEEKELVEGAKFLSSTIEMLDYNQHIETAVIDEIQLLGDPQRGWAWTNALVGVPANRVLLTGSPDALPLIQQIANYLGEPLEVRQFERFNPLVPLSGPSSVEEQEIDNIEPGSAIVCFSRRDVLELKQHIESLTENKVSVIYGGLAPEVRREEARRFRERQTDILVATDAISMGLNLPIKTVLFWKTHKRYDGQNHPLRDTEIKQIAGRAGRYGMEDRGFVGAFTVEDLTRVQEALAVELLPVEGPCQVMPLLFHVELLAEVLHTEDLVHILRYFCERIWFSRNLFSPIVTEDMLMLARMLEEYTAPLPLADKYLFTCAPVNMRATSVVQAHLAFARDFVRRGFVSFPQLVTREFRRGAANNADDLRDAEDAVHTATLYQWLAQRFSEAFDQLEEATEARRIINQYIARSLERGRLGRRCSRCNAQLPMNFAYGVCESCYYRRNPRRSHW